MASRKLWRQSKLLSYFGFKQKNGVLLGHPTNLSFVRHASLHTNQVNGEVRVEASLGMRCFSHSLHTASDPVPGCEEGMNKLKELKAKESDGIRINRVNDFTRCGHLKNFAPQYEKAASLLSSHDPRIVIAKAESNKAAATENKGQAGPASAEIKSTEDASCLITDKRISVVGVFPKFSGEEFENFMSLAEKLRSVYDFGHTLDAELLPRGNAVSGPTTRLLKSFDELFVDSQNFEVSGMEKFLDESSVIVFDKDRKNHPYVIKFFNSPNAKKNLLASMEAVMNIMKEAELQEEKVELSKKEASLGGLDTLERVEDLGQMLQRAREADDMHAGEVYGKKSILATEMRELQCPLINEPVKVVVPDSLQDVAFASGKNEEILVPGITGLSQEILVPGIIRPSQEILVPGINGSSSAQIQALIPEAGLGARQFSTSRRRRKGFRYDCGPYPRYLDWRLMVDKNKVPNIYDQYNLPSCWACAVATALEWKHLIEKGVLLPLSIQQLIDSVPDKKKGTQVKKKVVWSVFDAFELVRQQGITSGKLYPLAYRKCIKKQLPPVLHIKGYDGWEEVCDNNYLRLMSLLQRGPAVVNIRADDAFMIDNRKGLLRVPCYATPDHSMVCVGYDFRAEPHWILQNSWGKGDGNRGYVYYAQRDYPKCDPFFQYLPLICWQPL